MVSILKLSVQGWTSTVDVEISSGSSLGGFYRRNLTSTWWRLPLITSLPATISTASWFIHKYSRATIQYCVCGGRGVKLCDPVWGLYGLLEVCWIWTGWCYFLIFSVLGRDSIVIDSLPPNVKLTGDAQGRIVIVRFCFNLIFFHA
jgi:hypothetical protein